MIGTKDIYWLAGLLEGEGCFTWYETPCIDLKMTDLDTVERAHKVMQTTNKIRKESPTGFGKKPIYTFKVCGTLAASWMMTLYGLVGERRQNKIKEILLIWKSTAPRIKRNVGVPSQINGKANPEYYQRLKMIRAMEGVKI